MGIPKSMKDPIRIFTGQGINLFSCRPDNNVYKVMEDQKPSFLRIYDAQPNDWVSKNTKYVFTMIESKRKQINPNINWMGRNGRTRANISQTSLAIDSGATVHFFSNPELLRSIKVINTAKIYCGGTSFDQFEAGLLRRELRHLPLPRKKIVLAKDGMVNLVSLGKLVK